MKLSRPSQVPSFRLDYHPELDGVRGISILLVLVHHLELPWAWQGGFLGVDVFFVLSGFLITSLLLQEWKQSGQISLKKFYLRRALRLFPALYLLMLLLCLYAFVFLDARRAFNIYESTLVTSLYASNWVLAFNYGYQLGPLAITWSLAIEEQFYLLWPTALTLIMRMKIGWRWLFGGLVLIILCIALHRRMMWQQGAALSRLYYATDTRADALLIGCLAALLISYGVWPASRGFGFLMRSLAAVAAALAVYQIITAAPREGRFFAGPYILFPLAVSQIITVLLLWPPKIALAVLKWWPLVWLGRVSYGLYLWHWAVHSVVYSGNEVRPSIIRITAMLILSLAAAALSFYFVEQPFLRWKNLYKPKAS